MDAVHDIPDQVYRWSDNGVDTIKMQLGCFEHQKLSGSPNLVAYFESALDRAKNLLISPLGTDCSAKSLKATNVPVGIRRHSTRVDSKGGKGRPIYISPFASLTVEVGPWFRLILILPESRGQF